MGIIILQNLSNSVELISKAQCDFFSENSIVAFENNKHISGCRLQVVGEEEKDFIIEWNKSFNRSGYREEKKITEHAAEAISFFLTRHFTKFTVIEEAIIGTGVDYWLGYDEGHELYNAKNFLQARLEISGINKETSSNNLEQRIKQKEKQSKKSRGSNLPAFISIVEFSSPKAFFGEK